MGLGVRRPVQMWSCPKSQDLGWLTADCGHRVWGERSPHPGPAPMLGTEKAQPGATKNVCPQQPREQEPSSGWEMELTRYAAAAAAKSHQSCPTLCDPIDGSPPGSTVPGILQAREWVAISFSNAGKWKVKGKSLSRVRLFQTPWTAAHQAPPSMGFSRQECWSGCHCLLRSQWHNYLKQKTGIF